MREPKLESDENPARNPPNSKRPRNCLRPPGKGSPVKLKRLEEDLAKKIIIGLCQHHTGEERGAIVDEAMGGKVEVTVLFGLLLDRRFLRLLTNQHPGIGEEFTQSFRFTLRSGEGGDRLTARLAARNGVEGAGGEIEWPAGSI